MSRRTRKLLNMFWSTLRKVFREKRTLGDNKILKRFVQIHQDSQHSERILVAKWVKRKRNVTNNYTRLRKSEKILFLFDHDLLIHLKDKKSSIDVLEQPDVCEFSSKALSFFFPISFSLMKTTNKCKFKDRSSRLLRLTNWRRKSYSFQDGLSHYLQKKENISGK